jgi:hypothetical protein
MRSDMAKLLTEAERGGSGNSSQKWGKRLPYISDSYYEEEVSWIPSRRTNKTSGKRQGTNPLKGFLRKNLGRPWDKVYSDACQVLDRRSHGGRKALQILLWLVERNCAIGQKTGLIYGINEWGWDFQVNGFYVHPKTGLLKEQRIKKEPRRWYYPSRAEDPPTIKINDKAQYTKLDGIWYYCEDYKITYQETVTYTPPYLRGKTLEEQLIIEVERKLDGLPLSKPVVQTETKEKHIRNKHQLNTKELRELKLKNEAKPARPLSRRESKRRMANA